MKCFKTKTVLVAFILLMVTSCFGVDLNISCYSSFEYEHSVLQKLVLLEQENANMAATMQQDRAIMLSTINNLQGTIATLQGQLQGRFSVFCFDCWCPLRVPDCHLKQRWRTDLSRILGSVSSEILRAILRLRVSGLGAFQWKILEAVLGPIPHLTLREVDNSPRYDAQRLLR